MQFGMVQTRWSKAEPVGRAAHEETCMENRLQMGEMNRLPGAVAEEVGRFNGS